MTRGSRNIHFSIVRMGYSQAGSDDVHRSKWKGSLVVRNSQRGRVGRLHRARGREHRFNKLTGKAEKELIFRTGRPDVHTQFRHVRMTKAGTFLVVHLDMNKVVEYDSDGKEIWSVPAPSAWAAVRLENGNTLISGNQHGYRYGGQFGRSNDILADNTRRQSCLRRVSGRNHPLKARSSDPLPKDSWTESETAIPRRLKS